MQLSPPYRSFPLPRIRCGLFLRPSMCRRYRAACPRFGRAAARFASAEERQLSDSPLLLPALWCAKETLYKYSGRRNLDLLRDLRIERFDPDEGRMTGRICGESALEIGLRREEELLAAYILV